MYCVGIIGNIASGKSQAVAFFQQAGVTIINADSISRELTDVGQPAFEQIKHHFGEHVLEASGTLNRTALRKLIFSNTNDRLWLENLLHPLIRIAIAKRIQECKGEYCVIEIPLLKNKQDYPYLQRILLIVSSLEKRIERIIKRDNGSREDALAIISIQPSDDFLRTIADDVVINDGSVAELQQTIKHLHQRYLKNKTR